MYSITKRGNNVELQPHLLEIGHICFFKDVFL